MRLCLLAVLVLAGCASAPNRLNPNANRYADAGQCQRVAQARYPDRPADGMQCVRIGNVTNCQPTRDAGGWAAGFSDMEAALGRPEAERACMVALGW